MRRISMVVMVLTTASVTACASSTTTQLAGANTTAALSVVPAGSESLPESTTAATTQATPALNFPQTSDAVCALYAAADIEAATHVRATSALGNSQRIHSTDEPWPGCSWLGDQGESVSLSFFPPGTGETVSPAWRKVDSIGGRTTYQAQLGIVVDLGGSVLMEVSVQPSLGALDPASSTSFAALTLAKLQG